MTDADSPRRTLGSVTLDECGGAVVHIRAATLDEVRGLWAAGESRYEIHAEAVRVFACTADGVRLFPPGDPAVWDLLWTAAEKIVRAGARLNLALHTFCPESAARLVRFARIVNCSNN